jgi:hypothetical protein
MTRYHYPNGYGLSVVSTESSYGGKKGLFEAAVIADSEDEGWHLVYDTPITDDVLGWQTEEDIEALKARVAALPRRGTYTQKGHTS